MQEDQTDSTFQPDGDAEAAEPSADETVADRRDFLKKTLRRTAYVAPVVLLFKPREAVAGSGGSAITPGP